ncbi:MAG: branched-chain amino acid aminotransferase [Planctomycetota bacterium]|jgi:branched-chain amino acid aminotransferase
MTQDELPIWVDGELRAPDKARIDVRDPGFASGLSAIEAIRCERGCPIFLSDHLRRFEQSALALGIAWPPAWDIVQTLRSFARLLPEDAHILRAQLTRGFEGKASLVLTARAIDTSDTASVRLVLSEERLEWGRAQRAKHSSRLPLVLAREDAQRRGAFDALLRDADGKIVESTIANLFLVIEGGLMTPDSGLPGTVRGLILELAAEHGIETVVGGVGLRELQMADELFLTNVAMGLRPIHGVDGVLNLPVDAGPLTLHLQKVFRARQELEIQPTGFRLDIGTTDR